MKLTNRDILIYPLSLIFFLFFIYFSINFLIKKPYEIINFLESDIHKDFEIEIANNLNDINNYLKEYLFIESHSLHRIDNKINIKITLNKPFARNNLTNEVIFIDNIKAPLDYFKSSYLDNIKLIDISKNGIYINKYLKENYQTLSSYFDIAQIEYIDDRRYNLVLSNGRIVMLPKVIDSKLLYFIKKKKK